MQVLIEISDQDYELACKFPDILFGSYARAIASGKQLLKGHGALFDEHDIVSGDYEIVCGRIMELEPVIEADKEE